MLKAKKYQYPDGKLGVCAVLVASADLLDSVLLLEWLKEGTSDSTQKLIKTESRSWYL